MQTKPQTIVAALMAIAATANSHGIMNNLPLVARDGASDTGVYFSITTGAGSSGTAGSSTSTTSSVSTDSLTSSTSTSSTGFLTVTTATSTTTTTSPDATSTTMTSTSTAESTTTVASVTPSFSTPASGTSASPLPGSGSGSGLTGHCTTEGMFNCIDGTAYQQCASGIWSPLQPMPLTTKCAPGQTMTLWGRDMRVDGRDVLENRRRGY